MPGWILDMIGVSLGAFLGAFFGYWATWWYELRKAKQARKALGSMFHGELIVESPRDDPIFHDPPHAPLLRLNALPRLLAPGVIDPHKEDDLLMHMLHLAGVVENYNDAARAYNAAWLQGVDREKLQQYYNQLQGANWDYIEAHKWTMYMIDRLGPRPPILRDQKVRLP